MGGSDNKGDGLASQPRRYRVPGQPLLNRHQVGGVSRSPDGLCATGARAHQGQTNREGEKDMWWTARQRVEEQGTWAAQKHSEAGYGRPVNRGVWTAKTVKRPRQQPAHPQYANYWAPLTRKRHTMPHSAQSQHTNYWAPRRRKQHQQEHRPRRPTESSDPTQYAKGRPGDRPRPRKGATTRRNVTQGGVLRGRARRHGIVPVLPRKSADIGGTLDFVGLSPHPHCHDGLGMSTHTTQTSTCTTPCHLLRAPLSSMGRPMVTSLHTSARPHPPTLTSHSPSPLGHNLLPSPGSGQTNTVATLPSTPQA